MSELEACYEVRNGDAVVGPVSLDQIRRGLVAGRIPPGAEARRVTRWEPVKYVPMLEAPPGRDRSPCMEIRHGKDIRGPVSLYQIRRALIEAMIPEGSEARVVWKWQPVVELFTR